MKSNYPKNPDLRQFLNAIDDNDLKSFNFLLLHGSLTTFDICSAVFKASGLGHVQIVELLIAYGAEINHIFGLGTALTEAVENNQIEIIDILLKAGADCSLPLSGKVYPPLFIAAENGNLEIVKLLVDSGANVNQVRGDEYPLETAAAYGQEEVFNYLYPLTNPELHQEALDLLPEGIRMREIEEAADPLVIDLTSAVVDENIEKVQQILAAGADVNGFDDIGSTALFMAVRKQSVELVKLLIEAGANPNQSHLDCGKTPLMVTYGWWRESAVQICSLLLEAGADVNAKDNSGNTALSIAKEAGHKNIIQMLKEAGATDN